MDRSSKREAVTNGSSKGATRLNVKADGNKTNGQMQAVQENATICPIDVSAQLCNVFSLPTASKKSKKGVLSKVAEKFQLVDRIDSTQRAQDQRITGVECKLNDLQRKDSVSPKEFQETSKRFSQEQENMKEMILDLRNCMTENLPRRSSLTAAAATANMRDAEGIPSREVLRARLKSRWEMFLSDTPLDTVDFLYQHDVVSDGMYDELMDETVANRKRVKKLLRHIMKVEGDAIVLFQESLRKNKMSHLVDVLDGKVVH